MCVGSVEIVYIVIIKMKTILTHILWGIQVESPFSVHQQPL